MPAKSQPVAYTNAQIVNAATGHWGEIAHEVKPAEPVVINVPDSDVVLTLMPLTRRRRKALKATQAAYMMVGAQLAEAQSDDNVDQGTLTRIEKILAEAEEAYDAALFGGEDIRKQVVDLFDDLDEAYWNAMYQLVHDQLVNRVELPEDVCSKCGQEIEQKDADGGKGEPSST